MKDTIRQALKIGTAAEQETNSGSVRHSHEDALEERQFSELVDVARSMPDPHGSECEFVLIAAGRLGLRAGEISHMREDWINWKKSQIKIPSYDPCDHGKDGSICGYCHAQAEQAVGLDSEKTIEYELERRWKPKTSNSARAIPFDFDEEVEECVTSFFDTRDRYPRSRASINRRVDKVLETAGYPTDMAYPHSLRATAASWHSYRGVPGPALQALFGWSDLAVAQKYIRLSGGATQEALNAVHGD